MFFRIQILIPYFLLLSHLTGDAQEKYRAVQWGLKEGLAQAEVYHILQDVNGFLWIGTGGALSRFDGSRFKNYFYDPQKTGSLNAKKTEDGLVEDSLHNIWIGTNNGLFRYDIKADTFTQFLPAEGIAAKEKTIFPFWATKDEIYSLEPDSIFTSINTKTFQKKYFASLDAIDSVWLGLTTSYIYFNEATNSLWILRGVRVGDGSWTGGGLLEISLSTGVKKVYTWTCFKSISGHDHSAEAMVFDRKRNCLWINSTEGLMKFTLDDKKFHFINAFNSLGKPKDYQRWVGISLDQRDRIWVASVPKGIVIYDPADSSLSLPFPEDSLLQLQVSDKNACVYRDKDGIVWLGTWRREGIFQILPFSPSVQQYKPNPANPHALQAASVISFLDVGGGKIWLGGFNGIQIFDSRNNTFEALSEKDHPGLTGNAIFPQFFDTTFGKVYIFSLSQGHVIMDLRTRQCNPIIFLDSANHEIDVSKGQNIGNANARNEYFVSFNFPTREIIFKVERGTGVAREILSIPANSTAPFDMRLFDDGHMFLKGLQDTGNLTYSYQNDKWVKHPSTFDSLNWSHIIYNKRDSGFWVVVEKQLLHYSNDLKLIHAYTPSDGLTDLDIYSLIADKQNNIWFNTDRSIHHLNTKTGVISSLSEKDGFHPQDFYDGPRLFSDDEGKLYLGGGPASDGFVKISPEKYAYSPSSVYLQSLRVNQKPFALSTGINNLEALRLRYFENNITIETGIIDYYSNGSGHIRYKLEGLNDDWHYGPANYTIRFDGLEPNHYKLVMQSSSGANEFSGPLKTLFIEISPPWWKTWWAYGLFALLAGSLIWAFTQFRSRSLRQRNLLLEEKVVDRTKELKRSLEELKATQTQLIQSEKMASLGELTAGIAHEIQNPLNFVNNFSEVNKELIDEMKEEIEKGNMKEVKAIANDIKEMKKK